jgi:hypothetical protein
MSSIADVLHQQVKAERELSTRLEQYAGEWVAVRNHEVVAHADSLDALMDEVDADEVETVFRVAEDQAVCFY